MRSLFIIVLVFLAVDASIRPKQSPPVQNHKAARHFVPSLTRKAPVREETPIHHVSIPKTEPVHGAGPRPFKAVDPHAFRESLLAARKALRERSAKLLGNH
jgi:hypothetical protein